MNWLRLWLDFWVTLVNIVADPHSEETKKFMKEISKDE